MKKSIVLFVCIAIIIATYLTAQKTNVPIEKRWKTVEELANKQLPESALKEVESILEQARKENNTVQLIKATLYKMRFTLEKNPDQAPALIKEFETFTAQSTNPTESALLHSMTAELYARCYLINRQNINSRTEMASTIPSDIKEWTKNIYYKKITQHLDSSLVNPTVLQRTDALKYVELLNKGVDSRTLQPTLFDFLCSRKMLTLQLLGRITAIKNPLFTPEYFTDAAQFVELRPDTTYNRSIENQVIDTYKQLIKFRLKANNTAALLNVDLSRLAYIRSYNNNVTSDSLYLAALNELEQKYAKDENVVEILAIKANYWHRKGWDEIAHTRSALQSIKLDENSNRTAYDICTNGIQRFPNYKRIALLYNIQKEIQQKDININYKKTVKPSTNLKVEVKSRNISQLVLSVYRVNATSLDYYSFELKRNYNKQEYPSRTPVETRNIQIKPDVNFGTVTTGFDINLNDYGIYEFTLRETGKNASSEFVVGSFTVTDFGFIERSNMPNLQNVYVLDRQSGQPQADVNIDIYKKEWTDNNFKISLLNQIKSNHTGLGQYSYNTSYSEKILVFKKGNDCYFSSKSEPWYFDNEATRNEDVQLALFTDRSVYRPGQTVYFKGIAYYLTKNTQKVNENSNFEVNLYDVNNKKVSTKSIKTNHYGSFVGEFVLPQGGVNGGYRLEVNNTSQTIWMEEYKRPTFEVGIMTPTTEIQFGDKVRISGTAKAFAGFGIGNASVKYRVVRHTHSHYLRVFEPEVEVTNGTIISNGDGSFEFSFVAEKNIRSNSSFADRAYSYIITADVTDVKGETQSGIKTISVGDKSLIILANVPEQINKNKNSGINISTETLNGVKINSKIKYSVSLLTEPTEYTENLDDNTDFGIAKQVVSGNFETKNKKLDLTMDNWKSGHYKLTLVTTDTHGKEVETEKIFVLFATNDKRPPIKSYVWFQAINTECLVGETATIQFGTSTQNSFVLYEIMQGNTVLESRWIKFSDEIKTFQLPFQEKYGAGITVMFSFMKDDQFFTRTAQITRRIEPQKLSPTLSVFRNKLQPGEKAEWTITIPESSKSEKAAELLVSMYDASLEKIQPHSWNFNPTYYEWLKTSPVWRGYTNAVGSDNATVAIQKIRTEGYQFDKLNWFGLTMQINLSEKGMIFTSGMSTEIPPKRSQTGKNSLAGFAKSTISKEEFEGMSIARVDDALQGRISGLDIQNGSSNTTNPVQIRTNFNETAFFYPQLRTDANGNVKFSFTAPESLTRWNIKMLAHTKDLYFGQFDTTAITQKDLMVQMNLPRFVRRSDKLVLSANVINLTDKELNANVQFEMINPATEKPIELKGAANKSVILKANETKSVEWELTEFSPYELVTCKVIATAGNFSDGEQKYLPVLPDKVLVTESMPLIIRGNQTRTFNFESLQKNVSSVDTKNLSVEFSSNPTWYAVQALPTVSVPESDNAMDLFTAYYANSLASYIANSNTKIAATFDRWKNAGGSREALLSNLEKNVELKNMLLDETPWVMAAQNESEQKRSIALLFDLNNQKNQAQQYWDKLKLLQLPSGGFTWFKGMTESRYITMEIMLNLARLERMTKQANANNDELTVKALKYLDAEIAHDFENLKKHNPDYQKVQYIDNSQLFYLHVRSEFKNIPVPEATREAVKYFTAQSEKYWTSFTLYGKAMMAIVANRNGNSTLANDILKSLKENALKTDEFGMYWAKNTSGYFWNERPIAIQAAIIEAFAEVANYTSDIDEMKIWLLKQKQTQRWDSPSSTLNAIYALLLQGSNWLTAEGSVKIKVGNTTLSPTNTEAGTGYFKQSLSSTNVRPEMSKVTVTKTDKNIGWGAMYWQFYQELDKITGQSGSLSVSKKLFVEKINAVGKNLLPIEQTELKKGDKVITRLVITTDRNLEYVALKDLRASCFEPVDQRSGCVWKEGVCYYQTSKDASTQFFFSYLPKGTYVFEYALWVNASGEYTSGIATIQCQYAPEFLSHTGGEKIKVN